MPDASNKICWLTPKHKGFESLAKSLEPLGFESVFVEPPKAVREIQTWILQTLPQDVTAVIVEGDGFELFDALFTGFRKIGTHPLQFTPLIWFYEEENKKVIERITNVGIDDILSLSAVPFEVASRLRLRIHHAHAIRLVAKDITERTKREVAAETALKQREEFLSVCAHDLRSPIGLVQSSLSLLLDGEEKSKLSPFVIELLTRAHRQSGVAIRLVNDLLDVMSFEQGLRPQYELFNLHDFLTEFHNDYKPEAKEKKLKFHYHNPVTDWQVLADTDRIRQLLQNLFVNAVKFTEAGKNIYLTVTSFQGRRRSDPPYPMVVISFKDEGKGIPQVEVEKIFDRFSQIKDYSRAGGRGLGLTVAKQISNLHAGNLWVESEEGKGATFHVLLPHVVSQTKAIRKGAKTCYLVAEPSEPKRSTHFEALKKAGHEVHFVRDGVEALAMAFYLKPDVVVLRYDMHKISEGEVANILKSHKITQGAKVFLGLETGEDPSQVNVAPGTIDVYVTIPIEKKELEKALDKVKLVSPLKTAA